VEEAERFEGGWSQQRNKRMHSTVSFLLEGLRGRDCQGISLDNPLDTAMMVLSGVGSHYTGHGLKIPIPVVGMKKDSTSARSTTRRGHRAAEAYLRGSQGRMSAVCHSA
jgi:hypothetical protein